MRTPKSFLTAIILIILPFYLFSQTIEDMTNEEEKRVQLELDKKEKHYKEMMETEKEVKVLAEKQSYSDMEGVLVLEGNVEIIFGDAHLYADKVTLNENTGFILAEGNVLIEAGKDVISGSKFDGNIKTGYGTFYDVKGYIDPLYYFEGEKAERFKKDKYRLYDGYFTSCEGKTPPWSFRLSRATIHVDNYVYLINPILYIRKVPFLYFPFWAYPIKPERTTGLLVPKWGYNSRDGLYIRPGFFWAIRDNMDLKLGADWSSKSGWGYNALFRYVFSKTCGGAVRFDYKKDFLLRSEIANVSGGETTLFTPNRIGNDYTERWFGNWLHLQTYPYDIKNIININYVSDRKYFEDLERDIGLQRQEVSSDISYTKNWTSYSINTYAKYTEDLGNSESDYFQAVQMIPAVRFDSLSKSIFGLPLRYQYEMLYTHYQVQTKGSYSIDQSVTINELKRMTDKFNFDLNISYPWKALPWLSLTPSITLYETWYLNNRAKLFFTLADGNKDMRWGNYYSGYDDLLGSKPEKFFTEERWPEQVKLDGNNLRRDIYAVNFEIIGPQLYRIFETKGFLDIEKINHTIEPQINFNYIPDVCYGYGSEFDEFNYQSSYMIMGDVIAPMRSMTYSINNKFFGKIVKEGNSEERREIGHIDFSQRYDFRQQKRVDKLEEKYKDDPDFFLKRTEEPFSNIRTEIRFQPLKDYYLNIDFDYDPFLTAFPRWQIDLMKEGLTFNAGLSWSFSEGYQLLNQPDYLEKEEKNDYGYKENQNFLTSKVGFSILENMWAFQFQSRYNIRSSIFPQNDLRILYNAQCWSIQLRLMHHQREVGFFSINELERDIENDYDIEMIVVLRNVGPFEIL